MKGFFIEESGLESRSPSSYFKALSLLLLCLTVYVAIFSFLQLLPEKRKGNVRDPKR